MVTICFLTTLLCSPPCILKYSKIKVMLWERIKGSRELLVLVFQLLTRPLEGSTSSSISESCSIQAFLGVITSTILSPKYLLGWASCGKPAKSFLERPVSHSMTPRYFHCSTTAFSLRWLWKTNRDYLDKLQLRTPHIIEGRKVENTGSTFN